MKPTICLLKQRRHQEKEAEKEWAVGRRKTREFCEGQEKSPSRREERYKELINSWLLGNSGEGKREL